MQRFVLQENIKLLSGRLAAAGGEEDRQRLRIILAAVERELALLESMEEGVLFNGGLKMSQSVREVPQAATVHTLGAVVAEAIGATGDSLKKELEWTSGSKKA